MQDKEMIKSKLLKVVSILMLGLSLNQMVSASPLARVISKGITVWAAAKATKAVVKVASLSALGMVVVDAANAKTAEKDLRYKNCEDMIDSETNREIVVCEKE